MVLPCNDSLCATGEKKKTNIKYSFKFYGFWKNAYLVLPKLYFLVNGPGATFIKKNKHKDFQRDFNTSLLLHD